VDGISGVQIGPGATQLTRMPLSASSWASPAVKLAIAPFRGRVGESCGDGDFELIEVALTIALPGLRCGNAVLTGKHAVDV